MTKAVARSRASKRRRRNVDPPDLEALRPYTGLYMIYHTHARKTLWKLARGGRIGAIKCPTIEAVPPPCAELFLRHLEWGYGLERDVDDEEGRASIITTVGMVAPWALADMCSFQHAQQGTGRGNVRICKEGGDLHVVAGMTVEHVLGRSVEEASSLRFFLTVWTVTAAEGSVRTGTGAPPSASNWMNMVSSVKQTLREWLSCNGKGAAMISPRLRVWAEEPTVAPVTQVGSSSACPVPDLPESEHVVGDEDDEPIF